MRSQITRKSNNCMLCRTLAKPYAAAARPHVAALTDTDRSLGARLEAHYVWAVSQSTTSISQLHVIFFSPIDLEHLGGI